MIKILLEVRYMYTYYKGKVSYDGTEYCGWQLQKNVNTVQGELEKTLSTIFNRKRVVVLGASRTDSGVHALNQLFNFHDIKDIEPKILKKGMNSILPENIYVKDLKYTHKKFNSITAAKGKYYIYNYQYPSNPLKNRYAYTIYNNKPDFSTMEKAARLFEGEKDFSAYRNSPSKNPNKKTVCNIKKCSLQIHENGAILHIKGNRFLYNMIRIIAGTLLYVGYKKLTISDIKKSFTEKDRKYTGKTLDASGLILKNIYENN